MIDAAFRLSRIYAEGWNTASKLSSSQCEDFDLGRMAALNPYAIEPKKRDRSEGFIAFMR